jgi:NAD(P)-dependent dehydrogenase (short-subunit alcohol dehydrogenase family)
VALVTGAATGIGRATAMLYAQEGATVVVVDVRGEQGRETVAGIHAAGGRGLFVRADVADSDDVAAAVATAVREFGRLDIATANAGILGRNAYALLPELAQADFEQVVEVNFYGAVHTFRHAIPALLGAGGGALTATSSVLASRGAREGFYAYTASKAAIEGIVRPLAVQYAGRIRVNAVAPGAVDTEMPRHTAELEGRTEVVWPDRAAITSAHDIALVHLFLASDEARAITGQVIVAAGARGVADAS